MIDRPAWIAIGVVVILGAGILTSQRVGAAGPVPQQSTESKPPTQADVEAQLARIIEALRRENARRGLTTERLEPAETKSAGNPQPATSTTSKPAYTKSEVVIAIPATASGPPGSSEQPATIVESRLLSASVAGATATPAPVALAPAPGPSDPPVARPVVPSGVRSPLPQIDGFTAPDVQAFLGVPSTVQQGPRGTVIWHYLTPSGRQLVYFVNGLATVTEPSAGPSSTPLATPERRTPGIQGACEGVTGATGFKTVAIINPDSPVFIEPKFRTQPLTLLAVNTRAEVVSTDAAWYLIRFNDARWGRRVGYIHCSDVIKQEN